jgi:hypothetical protein
MQPLIAEFFQRYHPATEEERYWVAMMVRAESLRRTLAKKTEANERNYQRATRELDALQVRRPEVTPIRRLQLVPPPVSNSPRGRR